jgi:hypothetical protein
VRTPLTFHDLCHDPRLLLLFRFAADVFEHFIHLLECLAGCFGNTEKREYESEETEDCEEGVCTSARVLDERRRDEALRYTLAIDSKSGGWQLTMIKLLNQLLHVDNATPFALSELGKISDGMAHGHGPHVAPNENM